jgi:TDG/mug DNA glycosylase family protein
VPGERADASSKKSATRVSLPDLLRHGLDLVFVGINPSVYSAIQGHYFARKINRFWPAFSRSRLSEPARLALGVDRLEPEHDAVLLAYGIGFTDVVKRPTARADQLSGDEFVSGVHDLVQKLETFQPRIVCFQGMMGYRPFARVLAPDLPKPVLGEQSIRLGRTRLFVVPSPSPANAHSSPAEQTEWYDRIAAVARV